MGRLLGLALVAGLALGCDAIPVDPSAPPGADLVLTFDGRANPPVILRINGVDVAHLRCSNGTTRQFKPGWGLPTLPWDLEVVGETGGDVLIEAHVETMPKWLVVFADGSGGVGWRPALGPASPTCPPS